MKPSASIAGTTLATTVLASITLLRPVHADPPKIAPQAVAVGRGPNPVVVEPVKKLASMNTALKLAGVTQKLGSTPALETRLSPVAPRTAGGAEIDRTSGILFFGVEPGQPDGSYALVRVHDQFPMSSIDLKFPTENGKFYAFDCRVHISNPQKTKLSWSRLGVQGTASVPLEDGHLYGGFFANGSSTTFTLLYATTDPNASTLGYFYGCDFGKAQLAV